MKKWFFFFLILWTLGCKKEKLDAGISKTDCNSSETALNVTLTDCYTGAPITNARMDILEKELNCVWCLSPKAIATMFADSSGSLSHRFVHSTNKEMGYESIITTNLPYLSPGVCDIFKGCDVRYEIKLKPKIDLCVFVENTANRALQINTITGTKTTLT